MAGMSHNPYPCRLPASVPPPCPGWPTPLTFLSPDAECIHALLVPGARSLPSCMLGLEYTLKSLQTEVLQKAVPWRYEKQQ